MKNFILTFLVVTGLFFTSQTSFAHCDTQDGPVVAAAKKAIEQNNINYVLIWVQPNMKRKLKQLLNSP